MASKFLDSPGITHLWEQIKALIGLYTPKDYKIDYSKQYLTFEALESGTFTFTGYSTNTVSYSLDNGKTWTSLASATASPTISAGDRIMWKASELSIDANESGIGTFSATGNFNIEGNAMSLASGDDFIGKTTISSYQFRTLFKNNTKLISAENLILPATTASIGCYREMFYGCTGLTTPPELPATTLSNNCYDYMFYDCTSLKTAPKLYVATLANNSYRNLFYGCTLINYIECLATDISASNCTQYITRDVASTGTFVIADGMTSWQRNHHGIPTGWNVYTESEWEYARQYQINELSGELDDKVDKVSSSTDNAVVRFDGTAGAIQNSGVTIDDSNNVSTSGNVSGKDIIVHGTYAGDNYRKISSGAASNMYVQLDSSSNAYTTWNTTEFRRGANVTNYNLGSSTYPWNNAYAKKWVTNGGTSSQFVKGDGSLDSNTYATESYVDDEIGTLTNGIPSTEGGNVIDVAEYDLMKINEVKGKSLVMNQRAKNPNPSTTNNTEWRAYIGSNVSIEFVEDGVKATILNEGYGYTRGIVADCTGIANTHKILAIITIKPSVTRDFNFETGNGQAAITSCTANQWTKFAGIATSSKNDTQLIIKPATSNLSVNDTFTVRFASCIDLTQMFGAGNEPTTVEEVEAILGNNYYEYNTGEVVGNNVEKLDVYDSNDTKKGSTILNLSELTGTIGERLPAAYTKLEYIQSNGAQYIDTGISGSRNLTIKVRYKYSSFVNYGAIYGNYTADSAKGYRAILGAYNNGGIIVAVRSPFSVGAVGTANTIDSWHTLEADTNGSYYIDGTLVGSVTPSETGINSGNIALFNRSLTNPNTTRDIGLQISDWEVVENNTIIQHLIPAKRNSDNAIGMYDKVSGTFFTNSGTGEFIAGSVVQSVTIFPDGLHGVGDAYDSLIVDDDGYARRAVKRMWSVDLGSLTWLKYTQSEHNRFQATISPTPYTSSRVPNIINGYGYYGSSAPYGTNNEDLALMYYSGSIYLRNDTYENSTAADFKAAMDGVMLYYELATPIEYVLDTPVQCVVPVSKNGTVKQVPVMPDSTPMVMDVTYLHDNGGMIGGMINHLASLEARIAALEGG